MITKITDTDLIDHEVVSQEKWIEAAQLLLIKEKELTKHREEVNQLRRNLPWVEVEKDYTFEGPNGPESLADLFDGRSQLITYHFMGGDGFSDPCHGCSFISDHIDAANLHLPHHDVTLAVVSRAPYADLQAYKKRMGWKFDWYSSLNSDFNYDLGVSFKRADLDSGSVFYNFTMQKLRGDEQPGISVFYKAPSGKIYHTYSSYERGLDAFLGTYQFLDITPKGRNENSSMEWLQRHDEY